MKAKLKEIFSLELNKPLAEYRPEDENNFGFSVRLMVGPSDDDTAESFDMFVCTPQWINGHVKSAGYFWPKDSLVLARYDFPRIMKIIEDRIARCTGEDCMQLAKQLAGFSEWEFDGYQPHSS